MLFPGAPAQAQVVQEINECFTITPTYTACEWNPDWTEFAAWSWSERTGMRIEYDDQGEICANDSITFLKPSAADWLALLTKTGADPSALAGSFRCAQNTGWLIAFGAEPTRAIALHELGHPLTDSTTFHADDLHAVMWPRAEPVGMEKLLTTTDVLFALVHPHPRWSRFREPSYCHNELAPDFDLMIPEINGKRALLDYRKVNGQHTWTLVYLNTPPVLKGCTNNSLKDGVVTLGDVRGVGQRFASATLSTTDGVNWKLVSAIQ